MITRMKLLPKIVLVGGVLAAVGYGLTFVKFPKKAEVPVAAVTAVPTESAVVAPPVAQAAAPDLPPAPVAQAPVDNGLTPAGGQDAGLASVLKAGKK